MAAGVNHRTSSLQAIITPEEPTKLFEKEAAKKAEDGCMDGPSVQVSYKDKADKRVQVPSVGVLGTPEAGSEQVDLEPSLANTKELKLQIIRVMDKCKTWSLQDLSKDEVLGVLNRSLIAISHWSLQAQLSQLSQSKSVWDSRLLVENSLIKKEAEYFKKRLEQSSSTAHRVTKPASQNTPRKKSVMLGSPQSFKLVENTKPHPRMRRHMDNPSTSGFVRVFHLERI